jgi:hypothetical protein
MNSTPAALRTVLRPPSQPTSHSACKLCPRVRTITPSSFCSKPWTLVPRLISAPIAVARAARTDSRDCMSTGRFTPAGLGSRYAHREASTSSWKN